MEWVVMSQRSESSDEKLYKYVIREEGKPDRVYDGFSWVKGPVESGQLVAIVWFDGEPDLWCLESEAAIDELKRLYSDEWAGSGRELPVVMFKAQTQTVFDLRA